MKTIHETDKVLVQVIGDEIFIINKNTSNNKNRIQLRVTPRKDSIQITADNSEFSPRSFNGLSGFMIISR